MYRLSPLLESSPAIGTRAETLDGICRRNSQRDAQQISDSAAGTEKAIKASNQAVMPLRGKILNCQAKEIDEIVKSPIIKDILTCLGCGIGDHFNINNLRYNRIILNFDADADGIGHIALLFISLFLTHLPELLIQNKVFLSIPPLYRTTTAKEKLYWFPNQITEYKKYIRNHKNVEIVRFKGIGELDEEEVYKTIMDPENRLLLPLKIENMEEIKDLYNRLMGKNPALRREFILQHNLSKYSEDDVDDDYSDIE